MGVVADFFVFDGAGLVATSGGIMVTVARSAWRTRLFELVELSVAFPLVMVIDDDFERMGVMTSVRK